MNAPSLHEIAAMPLTAGHAAMRQYFDPNWKTVAVDDDGAVKFAVTIEYTTRTTEYEVIEVAADNADAAKKIARAQFEEDHDCWDEIENLDVEEVAQ